MKNVTENDANGIELVLYIAYDHERYLRIRKHLDARVYWRVVRAQAVRS